ncbi:hypothetical protein ABN078_15375 [Providencia huaxiensis]|uniref:hypothetical protein n=1 Tax=Providencia huaxiensis TaxID=2027290 RepID=UPI0032DA67AA
MSTNIAVGICVFISIPFLWTFFSKFFKLQKKSCCLFVKNIYLDESSLHQQPLFWLLISLPVIVSITLWSIISSEYKLEWTANGYAGLIKYSQLPLMMLALSPILGAFVISAHRSLQTFTQINATNKQIDTASKQLETARKQFEEVQRKNNVDIHIATRKYMTEQIENNIIAIKKELNINELYKSAFIKKGFYAYEINSGFHQKTRDYLSEINQHIMNISKLEKEDFLKGRDDEVIKYVKDITGGRGEDIYDFNIVYNRYISHLNIKINTLLAHFSFVIKDIVFNLFSINEKSNSTSIFNDGYYDVFSQLNEGLEPWIRRLKDINEVLVQDKVVDRLIPEFNHLLVSLHDMPSLHKSLKRFSRLNIGDKLAAENQNPPE